MKYDFIKSIAVDAGKMALEDFRSDLKVYEKKPYDLVTDTDRRIEKFIAEQIKKHDSSAAIYGEETGHTKGKNKREYIIDPLDGTANFVFGLPWFAVSIAAAENDKIKAAAVYNPVTNDLYYADEDNPPTLNECEISVSDRKEINESLIIFGFSANRKNIERYIKDWGILFDKARKALPLLAPSLNLCLVAQGKADAFIDFDCEIFGKAAAAFILQKAGGTVRNYSDEGYDFRKTGIIAANGKIYLS